MIAVHQRCVVRLRLFRLVGSGDDDTDTGSSGVTVHDVVMKLLDTLERLTTQMLSFRH